MKDISSLFQYEQEDIFRKQQLFDFIKYYNSETSRFNTFMGYLFPRNLRRL